MMGKVPWADDDPATLTREQRALSRMVAGGLEPKMKIMRATRVPAGIPVRLLSSRQPFVPEQEDMQAWWDAHERVVASIPGAVLVEATESGHMIPFDQPELVVEAITEVAGIATGEN
jgi:pimeloyl-ACP methyl ester carboxylesterase